MVGGTEFTAPSRTGNLNRQKEKRKFLVIRAAERQTPERTFSQDCLEAEGSKKLENLVMEQKST